MRAARLVPCAVLSAPWRVDGSPWHLAGTFIAEGLYALQPGSSTMQEPSEGHGMP